MMVNPVVDGWTKTLYHRKIIRKTQTNELLKTKGMIKQRYKLSWKPDFYI